MRRAICFILASLALSGCNENTTPLSHALSALRAGDHNDFLAAKAEAMADYQKAIQPGGDLCMVTMGDIVRYNAKYVVEAMDNDAQIFTLPEEDRLLLALKFAGEHAMIRPGTFIANAPIAGNVNFPPLDNAPLEADNPCKGKRQQILDAMQGQGDIMVADDKARSAVLQDWLDALYDKYGKEAFAERMRSASNHLQAYGYSVPWPPKVLFYDDSSL